MNDLELPAVGLYDGRKTFHPVTIVAVKNPIDFAYLGSVDVTAQHAIVATASSFVRHDSFELRDERDSVFDFVL